MKYLFYAGLFISCCAFAEDSFIVRLSHDSISISTPDERKSPISVIIENKTIASIRGKLAGKSENLKFFSLESNSSISLEVSYDDEQGLYFIPLSPPLEQVNLRFSDGSYEIPQKK